MERDNSCKHAFVICANTRALKRNNNSYFVTFMIIKKDFFVILISFFINILMVKKTFMVAFKIS